MIYICLLLFGALAILVVAAYTLAVVAIWMTVSYFIDIFVEKIRKWKNDLV